MRVPISFFAFIFLIATTSIISICHGNSKVLCIETERQALLEFKHGLIDKSNHLSSWVRGGDCCQWTGVICNNITGHVKHLNLRSQSPYGDEVLGGTIEPSLLNLKHLSFLDLSNNDFGGINIPEFIGSIKSLRYLNLSYANFSGALPHQFGNLSKLQYLDIGNNLRLSEPKTLQWVSRLSSLQYLDLNWVYLRNATEWLQVTNKLPFLVELHLSGCIIQDPSPVSTVNYTSLSVLDLSFNYLTSVPTWIFSLPSLVFIDFTYNSIGGLIPSGFQNISSLKHLDLSNNPFSASSIPSWMSNLYHLQFLALGRTSMQGNISNALGNLSSVTHLDLSGNMLQDIMPKCLESLCRLRHLDLSSNKFGYEVSKMIDILPKCSLEKLEFLNLAYNKFSGYLVDEIGKLKSLIALDVSSNRLSGPLPQSLLGQLKNLEDLDVSNNMLEGNVSELHFSNLTRLKKFLASNNLLTFQPSPNWIPPFQCEMIGLSNWNLGSQFPQWLQFQKKLSFLDISHTEISGIIPTWFWNLSTQFQYLNLSHNQLIGRISYLGPDVVDLSFNKFTSPLPQISQNSFGLFLSNNLFSGSISSFICNSPRKWQALSYLDIGSNLLSGLIPDCWENWSGLFLLNLRNNNLTGEIPGSLGSISFLESLNLRNNSLSGEVPSTLQHCKLLHILDLSGNQLSGPTPTWIGDKLSRLVVLKLRSNKFQDSIPTQICTLHSLQVLDLAYNNISGAIPNCLSNLSAMATSKTFNMYVGDLMLDFFPGDRIVLDALVVMKGREDEYSTTLGLVKYIDLSANKLSGKIFKELGNLEGLQSLNLARNLLTGEIPESIGNMKWLESLDLSMNQLQGEIPPSLSNLNFLSHLNLSYNNLTGLIPTGTQLQRFDSFSYIGNHLCGPPLTQSCSKIGVVVTPTVTNGGSDKRHSKGWKLNGLYMSIVVGFVIGFWGVVAPLFFIRSWRIAYYRKLHCISQQLYVFWATIHR